MEDEKQAAEVVPQPWKYAAPAGYVYYGVLGKTTCPFCRKWRDRFVLAGVALTFVILAYETARLYLENRD